MVKVVTDKQVYMLRKKYLLCLGLFIISYASLGQVNKDTNEKGRKMFYKFVSQRHHAVIFHGNANRYKKFLAAMENCKMLPLTYYLPARRPDN
jgi:hypothetical protein